MGTLMTEAEVLRLIGNLFQVGTITQTKSADGKALAKVKVLDRETEFFPVVSFSNTFKKKCEPIRVNEQAIVFCPFGEANSGFIIRGLFNVDCKEPGGANANKEVVTYEDGTTISYDTASKELLVDAAGMVKVICKNAEVTADTITINSTSTHNGDVTINGNLSVSKLISGQDGIQITGGDSIGGAKFECNINAHDINASGTITDKRGDLTNHSNQGYVRD